MYVLVKVDYEYGYDTCRTTKNVEVFTCIEDAVRYQPGFEMYTPESEREDFLKNAQLSHFWLQSFYSKETTAYDWWVSLLLLDKVRILELYYEGKVPSPISKVMPKEVLQLWDFHNNNYNKD